MDEDKHTLPVPPPPPPEHVVDLSSIASTPDHTHSTDAPATSDVIAAGRDRSATRKRKVGPYVVDEKIGSGSYATVWRAHHPDSHQVVAIKIIDRSKLNDRLSANLNFEILIGRSLKHPNLVRFLDILKTDKRIFLIMEYADGGDMAHFMKKQPEKRLSEDYVRHFIRQIACGLDHLHRNNIIHRDLKPGNLILSNASDDTSIPPARPNLKIADFGFARYISPMGMAETQCGSPLYMAPEVLQGLNYDGKADLWSVGVIMYEMLIGKTPFSGSTPDHLLRDIKSRTVSISQSPPSPSLSSSCLDLIMKLMRRNPEERCSYSEFLQHSWLTDVMSHPVSMPMNSFLESPFPSPVSKSSSKQITSTNDTPTSTPIPIPYTPPKPSTISPSPLSTTPPKMPKTNPFRESPSPASAGFRQRGVSVDYSSDRDRLGTSPSFVPSGTAVSPAKPSPALTATTAAASITWGPIEWNAWTPARKQTDDDVDDLGDDSVEDDGFVIISEKKETGRLRSVSAPVCASTLPIPITMPVLKAAKSIPSPPNTSTHRPSDIVASKGYSGAYPIFPVEPRMGGGSPSHTPNDTPRLSQSPSSLLLSLSHSPGTPTNPYVAVVSRLIFNEEYPDVIQRAASALMVDDSSIFAMEPRRVMVLEGEGMDHIDTVGIVTACRLSFILAHISSSLVLNNNLPHALSILLRSLKILKLLRSNSSLAIPVAVTLMPLSSSVLSELLRWVTDMFVEAVSTAERVDALMRSRGHHASSFSNNQSQFEISPRRSYMGGVDRDDDHVDVDVSSSKIIFDVGVLVSKEALAATMTDRLKTGARLFHLSYLLLSSLLWGGVVADVHLVDDDRQKIGSILKMLGKVASGESA